MYLGAAAVTVSDLQKELDRLAAIARGESAGIVSLQYTKEVLDNLDAALEAAQGEAEEPKNKAAAYAQLAYAASMPRDARYGCRGRKWMRVMSLTNKSRAVFGRGSAVLTTDKELE